ncbi:hypothetical protein Godav_014674 [Gossypium davidsonii]|uniref:TF-B3 domain-containing protein n=1 Tax=Gossypium davidsonii TaxID=34287 RepID=A0A7J8RKI7_GOSDV|nr:hypothetical protein [Gossypium davidsonii]
MVELLVDQAGEKQLIVIFTESSTAPDVLKVTDKRSLQLQFRRIRTGNKMILPSEQWRKLSSNYTIGDGYKIIIERISSTDQYEMVEILSQATTLYQYQIKATTMALLQKTVEQRDLEQLAVTEPYDSEPIPNAATSRSLTVIDERRRPWTFDYRVTRRGRVLSGPQWQNFIRDNIVRVGDTVSIERNDGHGYPAE